MAGFGFSIGDILAAADFVKSIQQAVREGTGSLAEYEGLLKALDSTETSLRLLTSLKVDEEHKPALNKILLAYERSFAEFGKVTSKYDTALGKAQRPSRWWQELPKKVRWQKYSKAEILRFQHELQMHSDAMQTLMLKILLQGHQDAKADLATFSMDVLSKLAFQAELMISAFSILICILTCFQYLALAIKRMSLILSRYQRLITDQVPKIIATATAKLQDANGLFHLLDLNIVRSWRCLRVIINDIFKDQPGWLRVKQGRYLLCDAFTTQRLDSSRPFAYYFRNGREINMDAIFCLSEVSPSVCPRCSSTRPASNQANFTCECGFYCGRLSRKRPLLSLSADNAIKTNKGDDLDLSSHSRDGTRRMFYHRPKKHAPKARAKFYPPPKKQRKTKVSKNKLSDHPGDFVRISILEYEESRTDFIFSSADLLYEQSPTQVSTTDRIRLANISISDDLQLSSMAWSKETNGLRYIRTERKPITCTICRLPFEMNDIERLVNHLNEHFQGFNAEHYCDECSINFRDKADLDRHRISAIRGHCGFKFHHSEPCTGHHPPGRDHIPLWDRIRHWQQCQIHTFIDGVEELSRQIGSEAPKTRKRSSSTSL